MTLWRRRRQTVAPQSTKSRRLRNGNARVFILRVGLMILHAASHWIVDYVVKSQPKNRNPPRQSRKNRKKERKKKVRQDNEILSIYKYQYEKENQRLHHFFGQYKFEIEPDDFFLFIVDKHRLLQDRSKKIIIIVKMGKRNKRESGGQ